MNHFERKLLTILGHRIGWRKQTNMKRLQLITGKAEDEILRTLRSLAQQGYLEWDGENVESVEMKQGPVQFETPTRNIHNPWPFDV